MYSHAQQLRSIPRHRFIENEYADGSYIYLLKRLDNAPVAVVTPEGKTLVGDGVVAELTDDELLDLMRLSGYRAESKKT